MTYQKEPTTTTSRTNEKTDSNLPQDKESSSRSKWLMVVAAALLTSGTILVASSSSSSSSFGNTNGGAAVRLGVSLQAVEAATTMCSSKCDRRTAAGLQLECYGRESKWCSGCSWCPPSLPCNDFCGDDLGKHTKQQLCEGFMLDLCGGCAFC